MNRIFISVCLAVIIAICILAFSLAQVLKDTPEYAAGEFLRTLGYANFERSYEMMDQHSKKTLIRITIDRFADLDNRIYQVDEMDYLLRTNIEGHRTVVFEDMVKQWCAGLKIKVSDLQTARTVFLKLKSPDTALVRFTAGGKTSMLVMKKETGTWKASWYPLSKDK